MPVQQYYYTSWYNKRLQNGGFQAKATSREVSREQQSKAESLGQYQFLPAMREVPFQQHPIALRYQYIDENSCILLCSQSNGKDDSVEGGMGRDENYFIHALFTSPNEFTRVPPIFYWGSPFWVTRDPTDNEVLPTLSAMRDVPQKFDMDVLWRFLAAGNRRDWFYKLLCAVIHREKTARPIILLDSSENIAMWIAAISCALPPYHRPLLSFTTYYQSSYSKFAITGVVQDTNLRYPEEYMTYFVLNAKENRISEVGNSRYAEAAVKFMTPELYDTELLDLQAKAISRFPRPTQIDASIDFVVGYADAVNTRRSTPRTPNELASMSAALDAFSHLASYSDADRTDLLQLHRAYLQTIERGEVTGELAEYTLTLRLLRTQGLLDIARVGEDLLSITDLLANGREQTGKKLLLNLRSAAGDDTIRTACNSGVYLEKSAARCLQATPAQLLVLWQDLWCFITPGESSKGVIIPTIKAAFSAGNTEGGHQLWQVLVPILQGNERLWLRTAVEQRAALTDPILTRFYYSLVRNMRSLEDRLPYRALMQPILPNIAIMEFSWDMGPVKADPEAGMTRLQAWVTHAQSQRIDLPTLLTRAIDIFKEGPCWAEYATRLLTSPTLMPLVRDQWEQDLVKAAITTLTITQTSPSQVVFARRYVSNQKIVPPDVRLLMKGVLAMADGKLDRTDAKEQRARITNLDATKYKAEAEAWMDGFFKGGIDRESHGAMVEALYTSRYSPIFWKSYWEHFTKLLIDANMSQQTLTILSFWFELSQAAVGNYSYIFQEFFLGLPDAIESTRKERGFRDAAKQVDEIATKKKYPWYPLIQGEFQQEKRGFLGLFGR